jgi:hypothetical protein
LPRHNWRCRPPSSFPAIGSIRPRQFRRCRPRVAAVWAVRIVTLPDFPLAINTQRGYSLRNKARRMGSPWLNEDRRFRLFTQGMDGLFALGRLGLILLAVVALGRYARDILVAFAGKETVANLALSLIVNLQADRWFAYLVGVLGTGYGVRQRQLRRRNIRRMTGHNAEVEKRLLPGRSSSGLTPEGKTRPEDR